MESLSSSIQSDDHLNETSNSVRAKLRRLKIQEEILTASAKKAILKCDAEEHENNYLGNSEFRQYLLKVKKSYSEIKNLFQDIKLLTKDQENLKNTDIDDIKQDILKLDQKIVSLKDFIRKEMCLLQVAEREIMQIQEKPVTKLKLQSKVQTKPFIQIVPSPVRALIKSPFKCMEVQRFQDFMKNSRRCGGWDEYNHNIFVHVWNKYYKPNDIVDKLDKDDLTYIEFKDEVCQKIFGIKPDDIFSHCQWYLEYIHLKRCQEAALNKWRENKRKIKNPKRNKIPEVNNVTNKTSHRKLCRKESNFICGHNQQPAKHVSEMEDLLREIYLSDSNSVTLDESFKEDEVSENIINTSSNSQESTQKLDKVSHLYKPTKQWENRCQKTKTTECRSLNVAEIKKLKIPTWRLDIHK